MRGDQKPQIILLGSFVKYCTLDSECGLSFSRVQSGGDYTSVVAGVHLRRLHDSQRVVYGVYQAMIIANVDLLSVTEPFNTWSERLVGHCVTTDRDRIPTQHLVVSWHVRDSGVLFNQHNQHSKLNIIHTARMKIYSNQQACYYN